MLVLSLTYWIPKNAALIMRSTLVNSIYLGILDYIQTIQQRARVTKRSTVNDSRSFRAGVQGFKSLLSH